MLSPFLFVVDFIVHVSLCFVEVLLSRKSQSEQNSIGVGFNLLIFLKMISKGTRSWGTFICTVCSPSVYVFVSQQLSNASSYRIENFNIQITKFFRSSNLSEIRLALPEIQPLEWDSLKTISIKYFRKSCGIMNSKNMARKFYSASYFSSEWIIETKKSVVWKSSDYWCNSFYFILFYLAFQYIRLLSVYTLRFFLSPHSHAHSCTVFCMAIPLITMFKCSEYGNKRRKLSAALA